MVFTGEIKDFKPILNKRDPIVKQIKKQTQGKNLASAPDIDI